MLVYQMALLRHRKFAVAWWCKTIVDCLDHVQRKAAYEHDHQSLPQKVVRKYKVEIEVLWQEQDACAVN